MSSSSPSNNNIRRSTQRSPQQTTSPAKPLPSDPPPALPLSPSGLIGEGNFNRAIYQKSNFTPKNCKDDYMQKVKAFEETSKAPQNTSTPIDTQIKQDQDALNRITTADDKKRIDSRTKNIVRRDENSIKSLKKNLKKNLDPKDANKILKSFEDVQKIEATACRLIYSQLECVSDTSNPECVRLALSLMETLYKESRKNMNAFMVIIRIIPPKQEAPFDMTALKKLCCEKFGMTVDSYPFLRKMTPVIEMETFLATPPQKTASWKDVTEVLNKVYKQPKKEGEGEGFSDIFESKPDIFHVFDKVNQHSIHDCIKEKFKKSTNQSLEIIKDLLNNIIEKTPSQLTKSEMHYFVRKDRITKLSDFLENEKNKVPEDIKRLCTQCCNLYQEFLSDSNQWSLPKKDAQWPLLQPTSALEFEKNHTALLNKLKNLQQKCSENPSSEKQNTDTQTKMTPNQNRAIPIFSPPRDLKITSPTPSDAKKTSAKTEEKSKTSTSSEGKDSDLSNIHDRYHRLFNLADPTDSELSKDKNYQQIILQKLPNLSSLIHHPPTDDTEGIARLIERITRALTPSKEKENAALDEASVKKLLNAIEIAIESLQGIANSKVDIRDIRLANNKIQKKLKEELNSAYSAVAGYRLTEGNPAITDLSDNNRPTKLSEKYSSIYDDKWTDALEELREDPYNKSEEEGINALHDAVRIIYTETHQEAQSSPIPPTNDGKKRLADRISMDETASALSWKTSELCQSVLDTFPDIPKEVLDAIEDDAAKETLLKQKTTVYELMNANKDPLPTQVKSQLKALHTTMDETWNVEEAKNITQCIRNFERVSNAIRKKLPKGGKKCEAYYETLIKFMWQTTLQNPPLFLDVSTKPGTAFPNEKYYKGYLKKVTENSKIDYVVWPTLYLHENGPVLSRGVAQPT